MFVYPKRCRISSKSVDLLLLWVWVSCNRMCAVFLVVALRSSLKCLTCHCLFCRMMRQTWPDFYEGRRFVPFAHLHYTWTEKSGCLELMSMCHEGEVSCGGKICVSLSLLSWGILVSPFRCVPVFGKGWKLDQAICKEIAKWQWFQTCDVFRLTSGWSNLTLIFRWIGWSWQLATSVSIDATPEGSRKKFST